MSSVCLEPFLWNAGLTGLKTLLGSINVLN